MLSLMEGGSDLKILLTCYYRKRIHYTLEYLTPEEHEIKKST